MIRRKNFTREEMIQHFSFERVNKAPAAFDVNKLIAFQSRHMDALPLKQKTAMIVPFPTADGVSRDTSFVRYRTESKRKSSKRRLIVSRSLATFSTTPTSSQQTTLWSSKRKQSANTSRNSTIRRVCCSKSAQSSPTPIPLTSKL